MKKKFAYVLNAIYYSLFLSSIKESTFIDNAVYYLFHVFGLICISPKKIPQYNERNDKTREMLTSLRHNKSAGPCISDAKIFMELLYYNFYIIPTGMIVGIITNLCGPPHPVVYMGVLITLTVIGSIPLRKLVFKDDRYLKYFKKFEKESKQWHRKWMWRTVAFCLGSLLSVAFGIYLCFACAIGRFDLWNLMARG